MALLSRNAGSRHVALPGVAAAYDAQLVLTASETPLRDREHGTRVSNPRWRKGKEIGGERRSEMHANEHLLRDLDQSQIRGDIEAFSGFFVDDVVVHFPGRNSLAVEYKGKAQLLDMFGRWQERTPEFTFDPHAYFADDEHRVCIQFSHYKRGNERLDSNDVIVYHFRDGKVSDVWLLSSDEDAVDAFLG
jgi:uncharacterized protein